MNATNETSGAPAPEVTNRERFRAIYEAKLTEAVARDKGIAIGVASALPESVEKIARFAHAAEANGLVLVPLSAAVGKAAPAVVTSDP